MSGRVLIYISYAIHLGLTKLHPHTTTLTHQASHISLHMAFTILKTQANFTHGKCIFTTFSHSRVRKLPAHFSTDNLFATYQANADQQVFFTFSCNFTLPAQALSINSNSQVMRVTKFKNRLYTLTCIHIRLEACDTRSFQTTSFSSSFNGIPRLQPRRTARLYREPER